MDFLEDLEMYDQAMNNAYDIITKKKTVDDIYNSTTWKIVSKFTKAQTKRK